MKIIRIYKMPLLNRIMFSFTLSLLVFGLSFISSYILKIKVFVYKFKTQKFGFFRGKYESKWYTQRYLHSMQCFQGKNSKKKLFQLVLTLAEKVVKMKCCSSLTLSFLKVCVFFSLVYFRSNESSYSKWQITFERQKCYSTCSTLESHNIVSFVTFRYFVFFPHSSQFQQLFSV